MASQRSFEGRGRDIWSHGGGRQIRDLLASALSTLLLMKEMSRPAYFSSPWMSDFILFENFFHEYAALFPELADHSEIYFSDYLLRLAQKLPVRIVTTRSEVSQAFLSNLERTMGVHNKIDYRFAKDEYHEKGILAPSFYIEGSMNITYTGVYVRGEKITYHSGQSVYGAKISSAYLEFDRRWLHLEQ